MQSKWKGKEIVGKKVVVWGTGLIASRFIGSLTEDKICFFIDSNLKKNGKTFWGRKIIHPSLIEDWEELYVLVPYNYYDEIKKQLLQNGLKEKIDFDEYGRNILFDYSLIEDEVTISLERLTEERDNFFNKTIVIASFFTLSKGYEKYFNDWNKLMGGKEFAFFSDNTWLPIEYHGTDIELPIWVLPSFFSRELAPAHVEDVLVTEEMLELIKQKNYLQVASQNLRCRYQNMGEGFEYKIVYYSYKYIVEAFEYLKPKRVMLYCSFINSHIIISGICKDMNIPVVYTHQGVLPGTFAFEEIGEMGESIPSRYPIAFSKLQVDDIEYKNAEKVWDFLNKSKLNRKIQPQIDVSDILKRINSNAPIIFYAGQKDTDSGFMPYTEETKKYHSPIFKSSLEAAVYLADICHKRKWNFIFKPHPMETLHEEDKGLLPPTTILVEQGDINELIDLSDVVVTIFSQTAYVSLIRHKSTVMLGYNQLREKGCCYEAYSLECIEEKLVEALKKGMTETQKRCFTTHIAQLLKYYLYDDFCEREFRYGREMARDWDSIEHLRRIVMKGMENDY